MFGQHHDTASSMASMISHASNTVEHACSSTLTENKFTSLKQSNIDMLKLGLADAPLWHSQYYMDVNMQFRPMGINRPISN